MLKGMELRFVVSLAALAFCGALLVGCGDDGNRSPNDLDEPDVNQPPACTITDVTVDQVAQEVVVTIALSDPDQLGMPPNFGIDVTLSITTSSGVFTNDIVSATSGSSIVGNTVFECDFSNFAPGTATTIRISGSSPALLPCDFNATVNATVTDELGATSDCSFAAAICLLSEPTCTITAPTAADIVGGGVPVTIDVSDNQGDPAAVLVFYSLDGGTTLNGATLTGTTAGALNPLYAACNPAAVGGGAVSGIATTAGGAPTTVTVTWDSLADGVGLVAITPVTLVVFSEDCTSVAIGGAFNAPCTTDTQVLNNGAPTCTIIRPDGDQIMGGTGAITIGYDTADPEGDAVVGTFSWSSNAGATWNMCTAAAGFTNPTAATPPAAGQAFNWDVPADVPAASLPADFRIRLQVDDLAGGPARPTECFTPAGPQTGSLDFTLVPISQPTCAWTSPAPGGCIDAFAGGGTVSLGFDLADAQADPISYTVCYSLDGGATWLQPTITATTNGAAGAFAPANPNAACGGGAANQFTGGAAGATTLTWDVLADGVGALTCEAVTVRISTEDASAATDYSACDLAFQVSNNGAPTCTITSPLAGAGIGGDPAPINYTVTDADSPTVTVTVQFSLNGTTWTNCTPSAGGSNPDATIVPGANTFNWASDTDIAACTNGVFVRVQVDDGVALPNRPGTCSVDGLDVNCTPTIIACRAVEALGTAATGPTGVNPSYATANGGAGAAPASGNINDTNGTASLFYDFDYVNLNMGPFNTTVRLVDNSGANLGNPVVLFSAGTDYTAQGGLACFAPDTFQIVLEANISSVGLTDVSAANTVVGLGNVTTVWTTSDALSVDVSANGLLTAMGENSCATISYQTDGDGVNVIGSCTGSFVACVDTSGVDTATRSGAWLSIGDFDATIVGLPSGPASPGAGGNIGSTITLDSGVAGVASYQIQVLFNVAVLTCAAVDNNGIGGTTQGNPAILAVNNCLVPGQYIWNGVDAFGNSSGYFDISTVNFNVVAPGVTNVDVNQGQLSDTAPARITSNCLPSAANPMASFTCIGASDVDVSY